MKIAAIVIASLVVGAAFGVYLGVSEFSGDIDEIAALASNDGGGSSLAGVGVVVPQSNPRVNVEGGLVFDFGVMEKDQTRQHTFTLQNVGDAPLKLTKGETTCKCTLSDLAKDVIAPGETAAVHLEWTPKSFSREFRQKATILTNDPTSPRLELIVHGRVVQSIRPVPDEVLFKNVALTEARSATLMVYCYRDGPFSLTVGGFEEKSTEQYFEAKVRPLTPEELSTEPDAKSGQAVTVTIKPGLSLGPIQQSLELNSDQDEIPNLNIPIRGSVTGDITLVAGATPYNSDRKILMLGTINRSKGRSFQMHLLVKGPHAPDVKLKVGKVDPADVLNVTIDTKNPRRLKDGAVLMYPITVEVPVGSRAVNRLGGQQATTSNKLGKITIETSHPQTKELLIYVQFATEG